jgi:biotin operon repressor
MITIYQQRDLLEMLKALADENRLTMVTLMHQREHTVSEMAELLGLSEPTISHHVSKLHLNGFLNMRMAGNQRFYRVDAKRLDVFKQYAASIGSPLAMAEEDKGSNDWIEALDWPEEDKHILYDFTHNGKLTQFPVKDKKWQVILRWAASHFEGHRRYSEKEVNSILKQLNADYATLRRSLIEYGFMRRAKGGGDYWLTPDEEVALPFESPRPPYLA